MRNTLEYPVTNEEVLATLDHLRNDILAEERIGDMRPLILQALIKKCTEDPEWIVHYGKRLICGW